MNAARKSIATTDLAGQRIGIVGGGIGGLTAALAFADRGASICVYEKAQKFSEVGAGVQITPNGARVLQALGLLRAFELVAIRSKAVIPTNGNSGSAITTFDLADQDPGYFFVHRAKLISLLVAACQARGVTLSTGVDIQAGWANGALTGNNNTSTHDLVVFADGIHSVGRPSIDRPSQPFFTGQVAWRAIVPGRMQPVAQISMGAGRHIVSYPLGPDQINLVAVQERREWSDEGWTHVDDPQNLQAAFSDFTPAIRAMLDKVETVHLWGLFRHPVAERWSNGRMAMLGDAAHPTLPFLAQGANLAIEDAFVLARRVSEAGIGAGLQVYQEERRPRVIRAIDAATKNAANYHLSGVRRLASHIVLQGIGKAAPNAFLNRLSWLYDHDVTASS